MLLLFKSILTVLLISIGLSSILFPVNVIVSVLLAAAIASSSVSKYLFPILAFILALA